jgi:hypothetical protein
MRPPVLIGAALIVLGAVILIRGGTFTSRRDVVSVGDLKITADQQQTIPPWAGGLSVAAGIALIVAGSRRRG